jgi:hypothetical protein
MIPMARLSGARADGHTEADDRTDHDSVGDHDTDDDSTLEPIRTLHLARRALIGRRAAIAVLWLLVVAGAIGVFGVHTSTVSASSGGFSASLDYPRIARAGWDVPWHLVVTKPGGFGEGTVTVAVSRSFFDIYETQGFHPAPSGETSDANYVYLEFAPPPGDTLVVDYDAYIQPTAQLGRHADLKVITDGQERVALRWHTLLFP